MVSDARWPTQAELQRRYDEARRRMLEDTTAPRFPELDPAFVNTLSLVMAYASRLPVGQQHTDRLHMSLNRLVDMQHELVFHRRFVSDLVPLPGAKYDNYGQFAIARLNTHLLRLRDREFTTIEKARMTVEKKKEIKELAAEVESAAYDVANAKEAAAEASMADSLARRNFTQAQIRFKAARDALDKELDEVSPKETRGVPVP